MFPRAVTGGVLASLTLLSSLALAADTTPPIAGTVYDAIGADQDEQHSNTDMITNWVGFSDPEWPLLDFALAIGTRPCGTEVRDFQSLGPVLSHNTSRLSLTRGQRYYATVRATNGAGLSTHVSSDGVLVLLADGGTGSPPAAMPGGSCTPDMPPSDAGTPDSGTPDAGGDGGTPDGGSADGGTLEEEQLDPVLGWGCGASGGSGGLALLALSVLGLGVFRRRASLPHR